MVSDNNVIFDFIEFCKTVIDVIIYHRSCSCVLI